MTLDIFYLTHEWKKLCPNCKSLIPTKKRFEN